jgi:hypothetical protein
MYFLASLWAHSINYFRMTQRCAQRPLMISRMRCDCHRVLNGLGQLSTLRPELVRWVSRESAIALGHGVKGSMKAPIVGVRGAKALTASNRRTVGLSGEAGFQGAGTPNGRWVSGARKLLTGDATAIRCTGTFNPCRNLHRRSLKAWGFEVCQRLGG